jgi:hypothetical protein
MSAPNSIDFVFLDDRPWPYFVSERSGELWLYYWSESNECFVNLRRATLLDAAKFSERAVSVEQASVYLKREPIIVP